MAYKSIFTYVDGDHRSKGRLMAAITVARDMGGRLDALAMSYDPNIPPYAFGAAVGAHMAEIEHDAKAEAQNRLTEAQGVLEEHKVDGAVSAQTCLYADIAAAIGARARFADLVVLSQPYGDDVDHTAAEALEGALFDGDGAVLVCPKTLSGFDPKRILLTWDGGREALRAARRGLALMQQAKTVEIFSIEDDHALDEARLSLQGWLARHGVAADIHIRSRKGVDSIAEAVLERAAAIDADLIVMGAYSHSRFREYVLGGVTRSILSRITTPVLLAH